MVAKGVIFIGAFLCTPFGELAGSSLFLDTCSVSELYRWGRHFEIDLVVESVFVLAPRASCVCCYASFEYGGGPLPVALYLLLDIRLFPLV